jgi:hypothetical protein
MHLSKRVLIMAVESHVWQEGGWAFRWHTCMTYAFTSEVSSKSVQVLTLCQIDNACSKRVWALHCMPGDARLFAWCEKAYERMGVQDVPSSGRGTPNTLA